MTSPSPSVIWKIAPSALVPALVYEIGNGAVAPIIPLAALSAGASTTTAALMAAMTGVGRILGDVPAAKLADRVGDRRAMSIAATVTTLCWIACLLTTSVVALGVALLVVGACNSTFYLARQNYVAEVVAITMRARALSTLAGAHRIGLFVGPFLGAGAIALGGLHAAFAIGVIATVATGLCLLFVRDLDFASDRPRHLRGTQGARAIFRQHRSLFLSLGLMVATVGAVRATRQSVLPLWADEIGLSATVTSLVFGIANLVDMSLFYPSGHVMDRYGRLSVAIPAMTLLGAGLIALPFTWEVVGFTLAAAVMSLGNGIGSGIMMTIGADVAPHDNRTTFLSVWRLLSDTGQAIGPVVPAVCAAVATLSLGIGITGGLGIVAAIGLARWVPRYSTYATPAMARRQREAAARGEES
ncbi:MFS transporter [Streptosporangium sp. NPDC001559]|uniref:MFS transporter n=1 Tax=Streptosporangium sp. NPDC001559 TaxID=3366187 RepID=UPI0036EB7A3B